MPFISTEGIVGDLPIFPVRKLARNGPVEGVSLEVSQSAPLVKPADARSPSLFEQLKVAWPIVLADYADSTTVGFGIAGEGEENLEHWSATVDLREPVSRAVTLEKLAESPVTDARKAWQFNTILHRQDAGSGPRLSFTDDHSFMADGITVLLDESRNTPNILLHYPSSLFSQTEAQNILTDLSEVLDALVTATTQPVSELKRLHSHHYDQIQAWNRGKPERVEKSCIHTLFERQCAKKPWAEAVCAWDGSFTYQETDSLSSKLAARLQQCGIQEESIVPILVPKSKWVVIAILGVLKAGSAFVLLDVSHPASRLRDICEDAQPQVLIRSSDSPHIEYPVATLEIGEDIIRDVESQLKPATITPRSPAYVSFTSGSTGKPKGVVIEHQSFTTNAFATSEAQCLSSSSRVLQYASLAFDVSIQEFLTPLLLGGCTCIPSETQRLNSLAEACMSLRVNWAELTPSVARLLQPEEVPAIQTLVLGGESVTPLDIYRWQQIRLICAYGPAECTIVSTVQPDMKEPGNIGRACGGTSWIVDKEDHHRLLPIGAIGELVIGGPIVGRGYLNRPAQTEAVFFTGPAWASTFGLGDEYRFYKTGDLAKYAADGSIIYQGRKDTQVKINGQRVELGEIEHQARVFLGNHNVAVELARKEKGRPLLVLFLASGGQQVNGDSSSSALFREPDEDFRQQMLSLKKGLGGTLPKYMIPAAYIPVIEIPLSPAGKVNRKLLQSAVGQLSDTDLRKYRISDRTKLVGSPESAAETTLRDLIASVLGLPSKNIGMADSFLELGGDSISAIALVKVAQKQGLAINVASVFEAQSIRDLVLNMSSMAPCVDHHVQPFSLLPENDRQHLIQQAADQCTLDPSQIEDIYPCTPLQEAMIGFTMRNPGSFYAQFQFILPAAIDLARFADAWTEVFAARPILRTRIVQLDLPFALQVVVRSEEKVPLYTLQHLQGYTDVSVPLGTPLTQLFMASEPDEKGQLKFVLAMHHAVFDKWSYDIILEDVAAVYQGLTVSPQSYAPFIKFVSTLDVDASQAFWKSEFHNLKAPQFPAAPNFNPGTGPVERTHRCIALPDCPRANFTLSTLIRLAYAVLIARATGSNDVVFGVTINGRSAPVPEVDQLAAPTTATLPLRTVLRADDSIRDTLLEMHKHAAQLIPFEQTGLRRIKAASPDVAAACQFQSLLIVQQHAQAPGYAPLELFGNPVDQDAEQLKFNTHPMTVVCELAGDKGSIDAIVFADPASVSSRDAEVLLQQLGDIIRQISLNQDQPIGSFFSSPSVVSNGSIQPQTQRDRGDSSAQEPGLFCTTNSGFGLGRVLSMAGCHLQRVVGMPLRSIFANSMPDLRIATTKMAYILPYFMRPVSEEPCPELTRLTKCQDLIARVLGLETEDVCREDDFFALGGDSAAAMQLVLLSRREGYSLSVRDIFEGTTVSRIAESMRPLPSPAVTPKLASSSDLQSTGRFSLLRTTSQSDEWAIFEDDVKRQLGTSNLDHIEDAYPCTAAHDGLLWTQSLEPLTFQSYTLWEVTANGSEGSLCPYRLRDAWVELARRHAALRTVLVDRPSRVKTRRKIQLVLRGVPTEVAVITGVSGEEEMHRPNLQPYLPGRPNPTHKLSIYQTQDKRLYCKLEGNQAFLDATSVSILLHGIAQQYAGTLPSEPGPSYRSAVEYLHRTSDPNVAMAYWKDQVARVKPCIFPRLQNDIKTSETDGPHAIEIEVAEAADLGCASSGFTTLNNVFQVAWGLTLQSYTGQDSICFGTLVEGRDLTIPDVNRTVGSFFNVLPCTLDLSSSDSDLADVLKANHLENANRLSHQHCSLLEILERSGNQGQPLFNTCLSLERELSSSREDGICFTELCTQEPTEYALLLSGIDTGSALKVRLIYWPSVLSREQAVEVVEKFKSYIREITALRLAS